MNARTLRLFLACFFIIDGIIVAVVVSATSSPRLGIPVGLGVIAIPFLVIPGVMAIMAPLSGWTRLAKHYRAPDGAPSGDNLAVTSAAFRSPAFRYNNCVIVWADDDHLHLRIMKPFDAGHAPLAIPWNDVVAIEPGVLFAVVQPAHGPRVFVPMKYVRRELEIRATPLPGETGATGVDTIDELSLPTSGETSP